MDISTERLKKLLLEYQEPKTIDGSYERGEPSRNLVQAWASEYLRNLAPEITQALLDTRQRADDMYTDAMIAHRWFAKEFGEEFNGRDFSVKIPMAEREMGKLRQQLQRAVDALRPFGTYANCIDEADAPLPQSGDMQVVVNSIGDHLYMEQFRAASSIVRDYDKTQGASNAVTTE